MRLGARARELRAGAARPGEAGGDLLGYSWAAAHAAGPSDGGGH